MSIVMEGVFENPLFIEQAVAVADKHNVVCRAFQLHAPLKILQERDKVREGIQEGWREPLGDKEIESIYRKLENNPYPGSIRLNTEELSIEEVMEKIDDVFDKIVP